MDLNCHAYFTYIAHILTVHHQGVNYQGKRAGWILSVNLDNALRGLPRLMWLRPRWLITIAVQLAF